MEERPRSRVIQEDVLAAVDVDRDRGAALLVVRAAPRVVRVVVFSLRGPGVRKGENSVVALVVRRLSL